MHAFWLASSCSATAGQWRDHSPAAATGTTTVRVCLNRGWDLLGKTMLLPLIAPGIYSARRLGPGSAKPAGPATNPAPTDKLREGFHVRMQVLPDTSGLQQLFHVGL